MSQPTVASSRALNRIRELIVGDHSDCDQLRRELDSLTGRLDQQAGEIAQLRQALAAQERRLHQAARLLAGDD